MPWVMLCWVFWIKKCESKFGYVIPVSQMCICCREFLKIIYHFILIIKYYVWLKCIHVSLPHKYIIYRYIIYIYIYSMSSFPWNHTVFGATPGTIFHGRFSSPKNSPNWNPEKFHPQKWTAGTWKWWGFQVRNLLLPRVHFQACDVCFGGCIWTIHLHDFGFQPFILTGCSVGVSIKSLEK